jgi:predicted aconitase
MNISRFGRRVFRAQPEDDCRRKREALMPASGELIRMMNYMDDITATVRRIIAGIPFISEEERKRLAEYMKKAEPSLNGLIGQLEKGNGK